MTDDERDARLAKIQRAWELFPVLVLGALMACPVILIILAMLAKYAGSIGEALNR